MNRMINLNNLSDELVVKIKSELLEKATYLYNLMGDNPTEDSVELRRVAEQALAEAMLCKDELVERNPKA